MSPILDTPCLSFALVFGVYTLSCLMSLLPWLNVLSKSHFAKSNLVAIRSIIAALVFASKAVSRSKLMLKLKYVERQIVQYAKQLRCVPGIPCASRTSVLIRLGNHPGGLQVHTSSCITRSLAFRNATCSSLASAYMVRNVDIVTQEHQVHHQTPPP